MTRGRANWVLIGLAGLAGAVVALNVRGGSASRAERGHPEPGHERAADGPVASAASTVVVPAEAASPGTGANSAELVAAEAAPTTSGVAATPDYTATSAGGGTAGNTAAGAPSAAAAPAPAFEFAVPASRDELRDIEIRCQRKSPEDCESAARALQEGKVVAQDTRRATMLRRIALTLYVKQCEGDRALACARLAEMHEVGDFVQKNLANAKALRARVIELCREKPEQAGCAS